MSRTVFAIRQLLSISFLLCAFQASGLTVMIDRVLEAPRGPNGSIFGYDDQLAYLSNGTLIYLGCNPPSLYTIKGDKYSRLIERYQNPIYETENPARVVSELIRSRNSDEFLYYARTRGAKQESYRISPTKGGGASIELVSQEYWKEHVDRMRPSDNSLRDGYNLVSLESTRIAGGLNPVIENAKLEMAFILDKVFDLAFVEHPGQIAVSPDKKEIAMIVDYRDKESGHSVNRLVILKLEYGPS